MEAKTPQKTRVSPSETQYEISYHRLVVITLPLTTWLAKPAEKRPGLCEERRAAWYLAMAYNLHCVLELILSGGKSRNDNTLQMKGSIAIDSSLG